MQRLVLLDVYDDVPVFGSLCLMALDTFPSIVDVHVDEASSDDLLIRFSMDLCLIKYYHHMIFRLL